MDLLRFATAGSVDDGKSSLIGRLLYDTKSIFEDQYEAIERASERRGSAQVELALLTDGLRAEREQNITIDVAYRYFATPKRKFIVADTPGHVQYTRNMVTGTSTAHLSVVLVDATKGVLPQSKRHAAVSALLGVPHLVVAVNKMDLVGYDEARFRELESEFRAVARKLGVQQVTVIPVSALLGDNVVERSENMPWYAGPTLLQYLEEVPVPVSGTEGPFRMAVQVVIRPGDGYRGLAGRVGSGVVRVGDSVTVLPSNVETTVKSLRGPNGPLDVAPAGTPVVVELTDDVDASRGSQLVAAAATPAPSYVAEAVVCWLGQKPLRLGEPYILLHTTRRLSARVESVLSAIDVATLDEGPAHVLEPNDLGRVRLRTTTPIFASPYGEDRETGSFVLVDPGDNVTVGAGLFDRLEKGAYALAENAVVWIVGATPERRRQIAAEVAARLSTVGQTVLRLDEETLGAGLNQDAPHLEEALRRIREVARLFAPHGVVLVTTESAEEPNTVDAADEDAAGAVLAALGVRNGQGDQWYPSL